MTAAIVVTTMHNDAHLLRRYVDDRDEAAFAEIVRRHLGVVYSCALRRVGNDAHLAEDVTQQVFTALAQKAPSLIGHPTLAGWLYVGARQAGAEVVRRERRRKDRERQGTLMETTLHPPGSEPEIDWSRLRPLLDDLLMELQDLDRDAVIMRYFEQRTFAEVAGALSLTEEGARKRVDRAVDRLRGRLARHGVTSTTSALTFALAEQAGAAVPATLAGHVVSVAMVEAAAAGTGGSLVAALWGGVTSGTAAVMAAFVAGVALVGWQQWTNAGLEADLGKITNGKAIAIQALRYDNLRLAHRVAEADDLHRELSQAPALPAAAAASAAPVVGSPVTIEVTKQGTIRWENEPVALNEFIRRLAALQAPSAGQARRLVVRGAPGAGFGATSYVVEQASKAGIQDITLSTPTLPDSADNWITTAAARPMPGDLSPPEVADPPEHP